MAVDFPPHPCPWMPAHLLESSSVLHSVGKGAFISTVSPSLTPELTIWPGDVTQGSCSLGRLAALLLFL